MSEYLHFDGLFSSKAYKVLDEKVQESDVSWHWRVIVSWPLTDSLSQKWLEEFGEI